MPGTFTYTPASGKVPNAGTVALSVQFTLASGQLHDAQCGDRKPDGDMGGDIDHGNEFYGVFLWRDVGHVHSYVSPPTQRALLEQPTTQSRRPAEAGGNDLASNGALTAVVGSAATLALTDASQDSYGATLRQGFAAETTMTVTSGAPFSGAVNLSWARQPAYISCQFTPASVG